MAFALCAPTGGSLPIFKTMQEFKELFHAFKGSLIKLLLVLYAIEIIHMSSDLKQVATKPFCGVK
jgi:hypothetical protein